MVTWSRGRIGFVLTVPFIASVRDMAAQTLASKADYLKYIDPMLLIKGFGIQYVEDGAADASVLYPPDNKPRDPVLALVGLGAKGTPLLIDCLNDGRVTSVRFGGSTVAKAMNVPLGYICLDILMGTTQSKVVHEPGCADDGLGACIAEGFYFRPDDYSRCWLDRCFARPWVKVVQSNWRRLFIKKKVRFDNPFKVSL